jgi:hypothetical protein
VATVEVTGALVVTTVEVTGAAKTTGDAVGDDAATTAVHSVGFDRAGVVAADGTDCAVGDSVEGAAETTSATIADVGAGVCSAFDATVRTEVAGARRVLAESLPRDMTTRKIAPSRRPARPLGCRADHRHVP